MLYEVITPWTLHGDPTEGALLVLAAKAGIELEQVHKQAPLV